MPILLDYRLRTPLSLNLDSEILSNIHYMETILARRDRGIVSVGHNTTDWHCDRK